ncbi:TetR family transcriptional regulator [Paenibacillus taihuensis]|uniref:TetR family transcriptional regulator n=1 Tax=Paenibacillus taihuensis TaxID=1156355 RepID=A0A3D9R0W4_9BACL|nr:TetR family transcriptional regulator [Paenibacillus taihuensis]
MPRAGLDIDTILQAAAELVDAEGLDTLTLATLAQKLGIRSPSLYNHVNGLPGLRLQLTLYGLGRLGTVMRGAVHGKTRDDAIRALAYAYLEFARKHPGLYAMTQRTMDRADTQIQQAAGNIAAVPIEALREYGLDHELSIHLVRGLRSLMHGFASIEQQGGFGMPVDLNVSFQLMVDTFLAGIHAQLK